jgi:hypothetical protein
VSNDVTDSTTGRDLGKVFISYSHADAKFVKKLDIRLHKAKFDTWLYEKDVLVGDSVIDKVSEAIDDARATIIVVSAFSVTRPWLRYELARATERMIQGQCRVLPVLIGDIEAPSMIGHLLYADCRKSLRTGFAKVIQTLEFDRSRYPVIVPPSLDSDDAIERGQAVEKIVAQVFDGHSFVSMDVSATRMVDWECYGVTRRPDIDINILFQDVLDYGNWSKPFTQHDWDDFKKHVWEDCNEEYALLASHRPVEPALTATLYRLPAKNVFYSMCGNKQFLDEPRVAILIDVSKEHDGEAIRLAVEHSRALFVREAEKLKKKGLENH